MESKTSTNQLIRFRTVGDLVFSHTKTPNFGPWSGLCITSRNSRSGRGVSEGKETSVDPVKMVESRENNVPS